MPGNVSGPREPKILPSRGEHAVTVTLLLLITHFNENVQYLILICCFKNTVALFMIEIFLIVLKSLILL